MQLEGCRIAENEHLQDQRHEQDEAATRVAQGLEELLDEHLMEVFQHFPGPRCPEVLAAPAFAIAEFCRTSALPRSLSTGQTTPVRSAAATRSSSPRPSGKYSLVATRNSAPEPGSSAPAPPRASA